jgi:hypothetical protein
MQVGHLLVKDLAGFEEPFEEGQLFETLGMLVAFFLGLIRVGG